MLSSILKLVFLLQLRKLSLELTLENCKIFENEAKQKTRATLVPGSGIYTVGFYTDVSSFAEDEEINFYLEINKEDLTRSTETGTELITPLTYFYFTDEVKYDQKTRECFIDWLFKVSHKSYSSEYNYVQYNYTVDKKTKKYLYVTVTTSSEGGFKNNVFFYLEGDDSYLIIVIIIIIVLVLIVSVVVIICLCKKMKEMKKQQMISQYQMNNNAGVNNQVITTTDNQGNAQYGGIVVVYPSDGNTPGK